MSLKTLFLLPCFLLLGKIYYTSTKHKKIHQGGTTKPTPKSHERIVYLIGAGPGAYDLITVRGLELLKQADIVLTDRLVSPELYKFCKPSCKLLNVGKSAEKERFSQRQLEDELLDAYHSLPSEGDGILVRLKGGDPFVFGLGQSEVDLLEKHKIKWEYVPGLSSSTSLPGLSLKIPLTHKNYSNGFYVLSGHIAPSSDLEEWKCLESKPNVTLVVLMCAKNLGNICNFLIDFTKWSADMPCGLIQNGATSEERILASTLSSLPYDATRAGMDEAPLVLVVGKVCEFISSMDSPGFLEENKMNTSSQVWGQARPDNNKFEDWWVFGYGSLIWKTDEDLPFVRVEEGYVNGFARRFWQESPDHRGTEEFPGRVVTLVENAESRVFGKAYLVDPKQRVRTRERLLHREKAGYEEKIVEVNLKSGAKVRASVFIASRENQHYLEESEREIADRILQSVGPSGTNLEYFLQLYESLRMMEEGWEDEVMVVDDHLIAIHQHLKI